MIPEYSSLGNEDEFFYRVQNLKRFGLQINFPTISNWDDKSVRAMIQDRMYDEIRGLTQTVKFYKEDQLEMNSGPESVAVEYNDDIYDFAFICYNDRFILTKSGVAMEVFHKWYKEVSPHLGGVIDSVLSVMKDALNRQQAISTVGYSFELIAYDFRKDGSRVRNTEVLSDLINYSPSEDGSIAPVEHELLARLDYNVMISDGKGDDRRSLTYNVEAPANRDYSGVWFKFQYTSSTYTDPSTGERSWIDPSVLLNEPDRAYEFFWMRAVSGFMKSLVKDLAFSTTPTYIP